MGGLGGARILSKVIQGSTLRKAVEDVASELQTHPRMMKEDSFLGAGLATVMNKLDQTNFDVVKEVGQSCGYPFNLWSGSHIVAQLSTQVSAGNMDDVTRAFML